MTVHFNLGPCAACRKRPANIDVGSKTCEACGSTFEQMCSVCADKPCPKCGKDKLEDSDRIFPRSLFRAIAKEDEAAVSAALSGRTVDLDSVTDARGETPLSRAARCKTSAIAANLCEKLIRLGASPAAQTKENGRTALILMVRYRSNEVPYRSNVATLLANSINIQDDDGKTALMYAAEGAGLFGSRRGNLSVARDPIMLGADPLLEDNKGRTALGYAIASNDKGTNEEIVDYLKDQMITRAALRDFKSRYRYNFDKQGRLNFSPSKKQ